jgi:outer membrane protein assembly factor BamB
MNFAQRERIQRVVTRALASVTILVTVALAASAAASAAPVATSAWPEALHDSGHSATATANGPTSGRVEWSRELGGNITPGPVLGVDGAIYVATNAGELHALDPATGADRWTFKGGGPYAGASDLSTSALVLPSGDILWPGPNDTLYDLTPSGQPVWSHRFDGMVLSPALAGSKVYVGLMSGSVWELDVSGSVPQLGWTVAIGQQSFSSPAVNPDGDVITAVDRSVVAISDHGTHGVIHWRRPVTATIEVSPAVGANGDVYVTDNDGSAYRLSAAGSVLWRHHIGQESYSSASVTSNGLLYFGDNGGTLNIVRAATGSRIRTDRGAKGIWSAQAIDRRGDVYFGTQGHGIYGFSASGHLLFHLRASSAIDSYPALSGNGTLFIGDQAGTLYAIR